MRGTRLICKTAQDTFGIIPAYAGNIPALYSHFFAKGDHPRVCGEHTISVYRALELSGSSPRMRGTPLVADRIHGIPGIIPAYAGNTGDGWGEIEARRDHPRVCGEHTKRL